MKLMLLLCAALAASGCGTLTGGAAYHYERAGQDCRLDVDSGRVIEGGIKLQLTDCDISVEAGKVAGGESQLATVLAITKELKGN